MPPDSFNLRRIEGASTLRRACDRAGIQIRLRLRLALSCVLIPVLSWTLAGCASLGEGVESASLPEGAPSAIEILQDLAANDQQIENFRGAGTFILESPEFDAIKKFRGRIMFRRPADLYIQGNHRVTNVPLFKLTCVGEEFLMEFPGSRDQSFYQLAGENFEDVPFSVSPSDIAREMFLPEAWGELGRKDARVVGFDPERNVATLSIGPRAAPRRRIEVTRLNPERPRWVVVRNLRLSEAGRVLADTRLDDYSAIDLAMFPTKIDAWFPSEATRMTFTMRNIRLNTDLSEEHFDIHARALELRLAERVSGTEGDQKVPLLRETQ